LFISNINPDRDDPKGTLQSRINGTLLHFNLVEKYELQQLINAVFMNADDQEAVDYIKNQNSNIRIIRDDWNNLKGKHLGPAVVRQLQKLTTTTFELKPGFVSVIIPVLDEISTIVQILKLLNTELAALNYGYEIIIIDGGSSDGTVEAINKIKTDEVQILKSKFKGRGGACRTGIEKSKGDVIGIFHADLEYDLKGFVKCLELNLDGTSKATIGIRVSKTKNLKHQIQNVYVNQKLLGTLSYWGSIAVSTMALIKMHRFFLDPLSGIKIFNKSDIENITFHKNGLDFEIELLRHLTRRNVEILEIPIGYVPRSKKNGKKTTILKGLQALKYVSFMGRN
jgi:glycosyltransferase involved in cell wall biosynthesis